jgi:hypothetical protein
LNFAVSTTNFAATRFAIATKQFKIELHE